LLKVHGKAQEKQPNIAYKLKQPPESSEPGEIPFTDQATAGVLVVFSTNKGTGF
jgi:hypothetical protein